MVLRSAFEIPKATLERLTYYQRVLEEFLIIGRKTIMSKELADLLGLTAAIVRRDLSYLGSFGTRGTGYAVDVLDNQIRRILGKNTIWPVVIIGAGNLGSALAQAPGFTSDLNQVVGIYDIDQPKIGRRLGSVSVKHLRELKNDLKDTPWNYIAVIATPKEAAQDVATMLTEMGVISILNFAPINLSVPKGVMVRNVDLSTELSILAYHVKRYKDQALNALKNV
jgi:redox-sensing transcriptional repressor